MLRIYHLAWRRLHGLPTQKLPRSFNGWQESRYLFFRLPLVLILGAAVGAALWQWKSYHYSRATVIASSPVAISDMHYIFPQQPFPPKIIPEPFQQETISPAEPAHDLQNDALLPDAKTLSDKPDNDLRMRVEQALREQHADITN